MESSSSSYNQIRDNAKPWNYIFSAWGCIECAICFLLMGSLIRIMSRVKWKNMHVDMKLSYMMIWLDLFGAFCLLFNSINNFASHGLFVSNRIFCNLDAIMLFLSFFTSIYCVGIVSLERCLLIVYKREYSERFYFYILGGLSLINIIAAIQAWILNGYTLFPMSLYCFYNLKTPGGFVGSVLMVVSVGVADTLLFVCYPMICVYRRKQSQKAQLELGLDPEKVKLEVNRTIAKSLGIILASGLTNGPYMVILIITWFNPDFLTPMIDFFQTVIIVSNLLLNTVILLNIKPELLKSLKKMWGIKSE
ncbi:hypothetical protein CONCODRAFT_5699 [Conidiobolus coronatus NRRL 28638]|uniref:G-protein coupled receptors family 1 profile domain-containing protein n=1 Tax=Conidiobolus coronatus (strain ATCC 28846 / CBS 209.66 / NRRL 28638) TaxID=796925 RepID=A0A137P9D6_CONC2|nr:hypothetical protein CONCODRAFT_5699 [Conidiobolus coronatus NRRL 28638]|eukprot:KXN71626.1 hypothetical protein CONCODRAFT_5699 [Conidiobolus coronatus NRRL 28638]